MAAQVRTVAFHGIEVIEVETQVTIASGLPAFTIVGLPDKAVAEIARAGAFGVEFARAVIAAKTHHGQSRAGRRAQGG